MTFEEEKNDRRGWPESDYKQFERKREPCAYEEECQHPACNCGKMIEPFKKECPKCRTKDFASCHSMNCPVRKPVESSEPQEKKRMVCDKCNQPINWKIELTDDEGQVIPTPVESQEELWLDVAGVFIAAGYGDAAHNHLLRTFSITRFNPLTMEKPDFESLLDYIDEQYLLNFNKGFIDMNELEKRTRQAIESYIESDNKLLREEIERLKAKVIVTIEEIPGKIDV